MRHCTSYVFSEHFYTSPYGLTEVLTRTSMFIYEPHTYSQIYSYTEYLSNRLPISTPIRPFLRTSLRTGLCTRFMHHSGLTDLVLSLLR